MEGDPGYIEYNDLEESKDASKDKFRSYESFPEALVAGIVYPFKKGAEAVSTVAEKVTSTVRNTYLYLIGGIVIVGILAIFVLGAGTKFMGTMGK